MTQYGINAGAGPLYPAAPPAAPPPPLDELRPLSTGEILDRTFTLYRQRFWLYSGLSSIAGAVATLGAFARLSFGLASTGLKTAAGPRAVAISVLVSSLAGLTFFMAHAVTQAATVSAVSAAYLGRDTSIGAALRAVRPHWFRYIRIALWQGWSAIWLTLLLALPAIPLLTITRLNLVWLGGLLLVLSLAGVVYGVIAYIRNSLGIVAGVSEALKVRAAMRRSKQLVAGLKGRVFALLLLLYVLNLVAGVLQGVFAIFLTISHNAAARVALEAMTLLMTFITSTMVAPVGAIALCLFYIDARVRKEGYDIEVLMERAEANPPPPHAALSGDGFSS